MLFSNHDSFWSAFAYFTQELDPLVIVPADVSFLPHCMHQVTHPLLLRSKHYLIVTLGHLNVPVAGSQMIA